MSASMPSELENEFREAFKFFDDKQQQLDQAQQQSNKKGAQVPVGHPGLLSPKTVRTLLRSLGEDPSDDQLMSLCTSGGNMCDLNSFISNRRARWEKQNCIDAVKEAFRCFDSEDRGSVSVDVIKRVLTKNGDLLTPSDVDELCREAKTSGGKFNYNEFVESMMQKQI